MVNQNKRRQHTQRIRRSLILTSQQLSVGSVGDWSDILLSPGEPRPQSPLEHSATVLHYFGILKIIAFGGPVMQSVNIRWPSIKDDVTFRGMPSHMGPAWLWLARVGDVGVKWPVGGAGAARRYV
jgi:hypothetical protein